METCNNCMFIMKHYNSSAVMYFTFMVLQSYDANDREGVHCAVICCQLKYIRVTSCKVNLLLMIEQHTVAIVVRPGRSCPGDLDFLQLYVTNSLATATLLLCAKTPGSRRLQDPTLKYF